MMGNICIAHICVALGLALLLSSCSEKPTAEERTDYRIMTYSRITMLGWSDFVTQKVCVISEKKLPT